jgi:raffinose/stachyose/melibiose transport system permease protein
MGPKLNLPVEWVTENYINVWTGDGGRFQSFPDYLLNSVIYTLVTVLAIVMLSNMAGYAFAKFDFAITKLLLGIFIIGILLTMQSILIPIFLMANAVGILDTRLGVLIPYIGLGLPMAVYLNTDFIKKGIPSELIESARIDGSSYIKSYWKIILPMSMPVCITISIICFVATWNEFMVMNILTLGATQYRSIPAMVGQFAGGGNIGAEWGMLFATLSLSLAPILIFYFIFRNKITQGVAAGAIKG